MEHQIEPSQKTHQVDATGSVQPQNPASRRAFIGKEQLRYEVLFVQRRWRGIAVVRVPGIYGVVQQTGTQAKNRCASSCHAEMEFAAQPQPITQVAFTGTGVIGRRHGELAKPEARFKAKSIVGSARANGRWRNSGHRHRTKPDSRKQNACYAVLQYASDQLGR